MRSRRGEQRNGTRATKRRANRDAPARRRSRKKKKAKGRPGHREPKAWRPGRPEAYRSPRSPGRKAAGGGDEGSRGGRGHGRGPGPERGSGRGPATRTRKQSDAPKPAGREPAASSEIKAAVAKTDRARRTVKWSGSDDKTKRRCRSHAPADKKAAPCRGLPLSPSRFSGEGVRRGRASPARPERRAERTAAGSVLAG